MMRFSILKTTQIIFLLILQGEDDVDRVRASERAKGFKVVFKIR